MENIERGWQATTRKIRNRLQHVLDSPAEFPPDVHFLVGLPGKKQEKIGGHKLILKAGSAVLYAMIPGPMAEKEPCIRIPDVQPGAFRLMLKFLYTDEIVHGEGSDSKEVWLAFRTMECARKYDVPELYFMCRSVVVRLLCDREECRCSVIQKILVEAFALGDTGLVDMAYYSLLDCCGLAEIDLESVSLDLLCYLLKQNETTLYEEEIYTLCLSWAKLRCKDNATPNELQEVLGKARYLVRYSEMDSYAIADGPDSDGILSPDEVELVLLKRLGSEMVDEYPFGEGERRLYQARSRLCCSIKALRRWSELREDPFINFSCEIQLRSEMPLKTCDEISRLCNLDWPFKLCIDDKNVDLPEYDSDSDSEVWPETYLVKQKELAKSLFTKPLPPGPDYVMAGDVALAYPDDKLEIHFITRPGFKPAEWIVVGRVAHEAEMELFKTMRNMKKHQKINDYDESVGSFFAIVCNCQRRE